MVVSIIIPMENKSLRQKFRMWLPDDRRPYVDLQHNPHEKTDHSAKVSERDLWKTFDTK